MVRLGIFTSRGHGEPVRARLGQLLALVTLANLTAASCGAQLAEPSRIAGFSSYRRAERGATAMGLFELTFFWAESPVVREPVSRSLDIA